MPGYKREEFDESKFNESEHTLRDAKESDLRYTPVHTAASSFVKPEPGPILAMLEGDWPERE